MLTKFLDFIEVASLELRNDRNMSLGITKNPQDFMSCFIIGDCLHIEYCILIECSARIAIVQVRVCICKCAGQILNVQRFPKGPDISICC